MPAAEIIAIGTELLLGDKQDTNTQFVARALRDLGVDLYRTMMIGDNLERIAHAVAESLQRADIVITTGGLGPTIDDPTRQAVALALGRELVFREELWQQILDRFSGWSRKPTDNNRRQAFLPEGANAISNPVGTAPAFYVEIGDKTVISLPGVPKEMEVLFTEQVSPILHHRYALDQVLVTYTIHVAGMGESQVDDLISDLETLATPTVGLLASSGQIDIRLAAKGIDHEHALEQIMPVVLDIRSRLGDNIFGEQDSTLEQVIAEALSSKNYRLTVIDSGLEGTLSDRLSLLTGLDVIKLSDGLQMDALKQAVHRQSKAGDKCVILAASICKENGNIYINIVCALNGELKFRTRSYGGPPVSATLFASTIAIDFLRRLLSTESPQS